MLRLYIIGIAILVIAIIANALIIKLGIKSWYDFLQLLGSDGLSTLNRMTALDHLWLFIGYPFVLGLGYYLGDKLYALLF
ncbi:MAG: hypothetical protein HKP45_04135 [Winogradskyella sp.]|nr:hypothetical protein [Winogradskyella sp.]MBT8375849.1 hypothetical protein [Bacteroidia bacterium]NNK39829.1 hypothetical protein [Winogradskyella sp.]NNL81828.1 hypothetical protein [Winogradskyella sp.]